MTRRFCCSLLFSAIALTGGNAWGQWSSDPAVNTAVCTEMTSQSEPASCSDGAGGLIVVWRDERNGSGYDLFAQRLDSAGVPQWTNNGVTVSAELGDEAQPRIAQDGSGGAVFVWQDYRAGSTPDLYAQRIDASGNVLWGAGGVPVCTAPDNQANPAVSSDGAGGVVLAWQDRRNGSANDIFAQRIDSSGLGLWANNGIAVCAATGNQLLPSLALIEAGETIVAWADPRSGSGGDIYAQRLSAAGDSLWTADGDAVCTATGTQLGTVIIPDGSGGAIVVWEDFRLGSGASNLDLYAQRLTTGSLLWETEGGVAVTTAPELQSYPNAVADGSGGVIVAWHDQRDGATYRIYSQHIDASGSAQWAENGINMSVSTGDQVIPVGLSDGAGGAIYTWADYRSGTGGDIYAQRVNGAGSLLWGNGAALVSNASISQYSPSIVAGTSGQYLIAWEDTRNDAPDVYAARISSSGELPVSVSQFIVE